MEFSPFKALGSWGWASKPVQDARPVWLTDRLLACFYGARRRVQLAGGNRSSARLVRWLTCSLRLACAEEDRVSWNSSYRQTYNSRE